MSKVVVMKHHQNGKTPAHLSKAACSTTIAFLCCSTLVATMYLTWDGDVGHRLGVVVLTIVWIVEKMAGVKEKMVTCSLSL